jgi:carboxypeptidase Taq
VLRSCGSILGWDQETYLPKGASDLRAQQLSLIARLCHERDAAAELRDLLAEADDAARAEGDADSFLAANVREARRLHDRATRVPADLVAERVRVTTLARRHWETARAERDFERFRPWLEQVVDVTRRYAEALGYEDHPYDALLDLYEPDAKTADINEMFDPLRDAHTDLLARIVDSGVRIDSAFLRRPFPADRQRALTERVARDVGFDPERGRVDLAVHPMCSGKGPFDVRITSRFAEDNFCDGFFSMLHEVGHALYEQGLGREGFGWPANDACSLAVHESQSRLWENLVGRSHGFWRHYFPVARETFPDQLGDVALDDFWRGVNEVRPSFIRVDADEVTYNLHIFLRFELEQDLLTGALEAKDVPAAWNERSERSFRLRPEHDADGCLQDIHWSAGLIGYYPTYTLGNVYGAQIHAAAQAELGDLDEQFARGEFAPLREWLNEKIHARGRRERAPALIERATGSPPSPEPLIEQLETKFGAIYGL